MHTLIASEFDFYLIFLRTLAGMPSVFEHPQDIEKAITYCKSVFEKNLPSDYRIYFDAQHNLIACPKFIDPDYNIVYLSAHVDTVDAKLEEWDAPFAPFKPYEDEKELVARGVSDCKAGVAHQLFLSHLIHEGKFQPRNLIFTITFKEEGVGAKTATQIGKELGKTLPMAGPGKSTYLIVLENNVTVGDPPTLGVYTGERSTYVIALRGTIAELQAHLRRLTRWNPVTMSPQGEEFAQEEKTLKWEITNQQGGHVCSVERDVNALTQKIFEADPNARIKAGDEKAFSMVPTEIHVAQAKKPMIHRMILNNRTFDSLAEIHKQLEGIDYTEVKEFALSEGYDLSEKIAKNKIWEVMKECENNPKLKIEYTFNIGGSDAKTISSSMTDPKWREHFYPLVMGPGTRSQRHSTPPRLTHGKNETFDKESGKQAVVFITQVLERLGAVKIDLL
ncbi:MAG: M20/M25/M40 family metallo-hydrolase [Candidatus Gracilibacteria bacterium]